MRDKLNVIVNMDIEKIVGSSHVLTLLEVYAHLYLNGGQPRICEKSLREYHRKLIIDYKINMEKLEKIHFLKWEGRKYIPGIFNKKGELVAGHLHINSKYLTDEKAVELLELGALKESEFHILPGEKTKKVKYSKGRLIEVIQTGDYKELVKVAKTLELIESKGNPSKEAVVAKISEHIDNL